MEIHVTSLSIRNDFRDCKDFCFREFGDRVKNRISLNEANSFKCKWLCNRPICTRLMFQLYLKLYCWQLSNRALFGHSSSSSFLCNNVLQASQKGLEPILCERHIDICYKIFWLISNHNLFKRPVRARGIRSMIHEIKCKFHLKLSTRLQKGMVDIN